MMSLVAGGGHEDVGRLDHVLERRHLVALHGRLQRADRIDLGDHHAGALTLQRLRAPLPDVAVAADHRDLAREHHVGRAEDAVGERVPAAVQVVELRLGDRVVDVDGRKEQRPRLHHLVEPVHAGGRLLRDAANVRREPGPAAPDPPLSERRSTSRITPHSSGSFSASKSGTCPAFSNSAPLWTSERRVAAVVEQEVRAGAVGPQQRLLGAPPVLLQRLALPGEDRHALGIVDGTPSGRARRRRRRGPASRRCCTTPSGRRRRGRRASRSARRSAPSCGASP